MSTALFFAQAVGRFVRARRRGETASVFVPSVPVLLGLAAELEAERDHVVAQAQKDADEELAGEPDAQDAGTPLDGKAFETLKASAKFDRVLFDGGEFGTATEAGSPEEEDFLGLPGLLDPDQVRSCCASARRRRWRRDQRQELVPASACPRRPAFLLRQRQARMSQRHRGRHQARLPRP